MKAILEFSIPLGQDIPDLADPEIQRVIANKELMPLAGNEGTVRIEKSADSLKMILETDIPKSMNNPIGRKLIEKALTSNLPRIFKNKGGKIQIRFEKEKE